jgi:hypothetical protein
MTRDGLLWRIVTTYYRVRLFLGIVWRKDDEQAPRMSAAMAWSIVCDIYDGPPYRFRRREDCPEWWADAVGEGWRFPR